MSIENDNAQRRFHPIAIPLAVDKDEENVKSSKNILFKRARICKSQATTDAYVDSELIFDCRLLSRVLINVQNKHSANGLTFKVLSCIDPENWETLDESGTTEFDVAVGATKVLDFTTSWAWLKLQVKSTVAGNAAICNALVSGKTP